VEVHSPSSPPCGLLGGRDLLGRRWLSWKLASRVLVDLPVSAESPNPRRLLPGWWERRGEELILLALPQFVHCVEKGDQAEELLNSFARPGTRNSKPSNLLIDDPIDKPSRDLEIRRPFLRQGSQRRQPRWRAVTSTDSSTTLKLWDKSRVLVPERRLTSFSKRTGLAR
jgi:hypothetical protein